MKYEVKTQDQLNHYVELTETAYKQVRTLYNTLCELSLSGTDFSAVGSVFNVMRYLDEHLHGSLSMMREGSASDLGV